MKAAYQPIRPEGMFLVTVTKSLVPDTMVRLHYEFAYTVACRPSPNDFINQFAELVCRNGKKPAKTYAAMLGVGELQLVEALHALSGAGIREWTDAFAQAVGEALLRDTNWTIGRVAQEARFTSLSIFSRFFRKKYKCTPQEWRWAARRG
jgi:AraC-like DNA-binding protein